MTNEFIHNPQQVRDIWHALIPLKCFHMNVHREFRKQITIGIRSKKLNTNTDQVQPPWRTYWTRGQLKQMLLWNWKYGNVQRGDQYQLITEELKKVGHEDIRESSIHNKPRMSLKFTKFGYFLSHINSRKSKLIALCYSVYNSTHKKVHDTATCK